MIPSRSKSIRIKLICLVVLLQVCCLPFVQSLQAEDTPSVVYVEVAASKVRKEPKHWAPGVADVVYGNPLTVSSRNNGWIKVRTNSGVDGFIHESAVTARKIALAPGSGSVSIKADESDVVLAGKGFNKDIEAGYKGDKDRSAAYSMVDEIQNFTLNDELVSHFVTTGQLKDGE